MVRRRLSLVAAVALFVVSWAPPPASAEWAIDLYGGAAFTADLDVTIRNGTTIEDTAKMDTVATGGARLGYWFDIIGIPWLGAALDVSYFGPSGDGPLSNVRLEVVPITPMVMFRLPLASSPDFPNGQVQPYLAGGPSFFISRIKVESPIVGERTSESQVDVGADLRAGIAFLFTSHVGIFVEGRYTFFTATPGGRSAEFDIESFHVLGGLTLRW